jgi:hypothetical protein
MSNLNNLHEANFNVRLKVSDTYTKILMKLLEKNGHFKKVVRQANKEEEHRGIDWWVIFDEKEVPIQFKLRDKRKDVPVCRYQPLYGMDHDKNVDGRDFRGIESKSSEFYYVAIRDKNKRFFQIYRCSSNKLRKLVMNCDKAWEKSGGVYAKNFFNSKNVQEWVDKKVFTKLIFSDEYGCQIWWKKNRVEKSPKLNMYVPETFKEWEFKIDKNMADFIDKMYANLIDSKETVEFE